MKNTLKKTISSVVFGSLMFFGTLLDVTGRKNFKSKKHRKNFVLKKKFKKKISKRIMEKTSRNTVKKTTEKTTPRRKFQSLKTIKQNIIKNLYKGSSRKSLRNSALKKKEDFETTKKKHEAEQEETKKRLTGIIKFLEKKTLDLRAKEEKIMEQNPEYQENGVKNFLNTQEWNDILLFLQPRAL